MADNELRNLNLNISTKQRFSIDGDEGKIIELDVHDLGVITRLNDSLSKIHSVEDKWNSLSAKSASSSENTEDEEKSIGEFSTAFAEIETEMRSIVDEIFDCNGMCNTILDNTSIFSPINGRFKFEQIIDGVVSLYEENIQTEAKKINKRKIEQRTSKYTHQ